jgi:hypothetical protein
MLVQMGWREGGGLGAGSRGRLEPVIVQPKFDRGGLGSNANIERVQAATSPCFRRAGVINS